MLVTRLATLLALAVSAGAQNEILYYKFDEAGGTKVANLAPASSPAPEEGTVSTNDTSGFAPGRLGLGALRGGGGGFTTYVDTGWNGTFSGDFSVAYFARQRNVVSGATYLFGNNVGLGFRSFTGGAAGRGLRVTSWGGSPTNLDTARDVQTMVQNAWVHIAFVVDSSRGTATWFFDGIAEPPIPITSAASVTGGGFRVGAQLTPSSTWDIDEFRFVNRAASPAEIITWSRSFAADSPIGTGCGATLASTSPPRIGNATYALQLTAAPTQPFALALGTSRTDFGGIPLPLDLGIVFPALQNCQWHTNIVFVLPGATNGTGTGTVTLPIPPDNAFEAASIYAQALVLRAGNEQSSNALTISIGF